MPAVRSDLQASDTVKAAANRPPIQGHTMGDRRPEPEPRDMAAAACAVWLITAEAAVADRTCHRQGTPDRPTGRRLGRRLGDGGTGAGTWRHGAVVREDVLLSRRLAVATLQR